MGKSSASCFRMISCGGDSVVEDRQTLPQSKSSSDRCGGWSFRKRSARHRVLSNTVISEVASFTSKESQESIATNFQVQPNLTENISVVQMTQEKNELPAKIDSSLSEIVSLREDDCRADVTIDESSIIIIQTAIRGYLAQQILLKQKNAIKLQAAVRGHLVRRHAVGTLRCIQAIIKMQTLVRKHQTSLFEEGSGNCEQQNGDSGKCKLLRSQGAAEPNVLGTGTSIEKLLSNKFARQIIESTPRTQPINLKCEPLKSDSAWKWLERWMSVTSVINDEPHESGSAGQKYEKEVCEHADGKGNILDQSGYHFDSKDFKPATRPSDETSESDDLITYVPDKFDLHACSSTSPSPGHSKLQNVDKPDSGCNISQPDPSGLKETVLIPKVEMTSLPDEQDAGNNRCVPALGQLSTVQPETEAEKFSLKAGNPSLVAIPSKCEELSSAGTSSNITTLLSDSPAVQSSFRSVSTGPAFSSREIGSVDTSFSNNSAIQVARSECGTELSISSTLDSPDRSESGANAIEKESKMLDAADDPGKRSNLRLEVNDDSCILGTELSYPNISELEHYGGGDSVRGECVDSIVATDSLGLGKKLESDQSNLQGDPESDASHLVNKLLPEASPKSRATVTESQAMPSGQRSVEPEKIVGEKHEDKRNNKRSLSTTTPNRDSPSSSSLEHKTAKQRTSFGSANPNHAHQETRDVSSNNPVPGYMQATESARAKAMSNGSPRASPDVQDKDIQRGSQPRTKVRQGSPRVNRSPSQAQQNAAGTGIHSPQGRKWRL